MITPDKDNEKHGV